jgi:hypothetical protein
VLIGVNNEIAVENELSNQRKGGQHGCEGTTVRIFKWRPPYDLSEKTLGIAASEV